MKRRRFRLRSPAAALAGAMLFRAVLFADAVGYSMVRDIRAETDLVVAEHHHDWSRATQDARLKMITTTKDPFTAENTHSYLRLIDRKSGREIFRRPVPALTWLWISPDSRFVVGLSDVKLWNPYTLVVFNRSGRRLFERGFTDQPWPGISPSVTNSVIWYKEPVPKIQLEETGDWATLSIEDTLGVFRPFRFRTAD